jgi:hypothetical protein
MAGPARSLPRTAVKLLSPRTLTVVAATALVVPALALGLPVADYSKPAARDTEPVILTGKDFAGWSVPANVTAKAPLTDVPDVGFCMRNDDDCANAHNDYADPEVDSSVATGERVVGTPVDQLVGYRWKDGRFEQIPFQVDEMFTRYLDNSASGFAFYSGQDQHTSYAFDREGFRYTASDPNNPCLAVPAGGQKTTPDPVRGLDDNDELVFMADDTGSEAPADAPMPAGIEELRQVRITDPTDPDAVRIAYVAKAAADGPKAAFDRNNGYVRYERDANSDFFEKSESSYDNYGNAARGKVCDAEGNVIGDGERRRPRDYATITTDRYKFRYDGRWLMTDVRISPDGGETYGPDLVDRWKARAFQQDPSSETPCCGYEEEDTNWGGSSTLMGERSGAVRTIRETWGADSGTNVVRRETFYRDEVRQKNFLRVHVIPPLDGIYAQWDFNAGAMTRFHTSASSVTKPEGFKIDGKNDEAFGNLDDPCNDRYDANDTSDLDQQYRELYAQVPGLCTSLLPDAACQPADMVLDPLNDFINEEPTGQVPDVPRPCGSFPYHQSIDMPDPSMSEVGAGLQWNVTAGPHGSIVDRYQIDDLTEQSAGGLAQSTFAVPYYRDDACFDDGTGTNPGRKVNLRSSNEPDTYIAPDGTTKPRECWDADAPDAGEDLETERYYQGSIGTHGLHILMIADSDNARQTVPVTEMVAEQRMVMLPGERDASAGEQYGRGFEKPLVATALPTRHPANEPPAASFTVAPDVPFTGREATFDSTSSDPDGTVVEQAWDLDGDGQFDDSTTDPAKHVFTTPGEHTVGLRVTDSGGATDEEKKTITVTDPPPPTPGGGDPGNGRPTDPPDGGAPGPGGPPPGPQGPPPGPRPPQPAPPAPSPQPTASIRSKRVLVTPRGVALVRVACSSAATRRCSGRLVLERTVRGQALRLGSRTLTLDAGETRFVKVRLNRAGRSTLGLRRAMRARAVMFGRDSAPRRRARTVTLRLRGA